MKEKNSGGKTLRELLKVQEILVAPGAYDALTAKMIASLGFKAAYVGGASTSYGALGLPDIGFIGLADMVQQIERLRKTVNIPLICDADTGYGNEINVIHTVEEYENAGASAIQIEDQKFPKRCGHLQGKEVIPANEMVSKVKAAVSSRKDSLIIARTDALSVSGLDDAISRANSYIDAGADIAFVESPKNIDDLAVIGKKVKGFKIANMVEGGKTPILSAKRLKQLGFHIVIYPASAVRAGAKSILEMLSALKSTGSTLEYSQSMLSFDELQELLGLPKILEKGKKFA
ncbi:MAG: isocitrate lyase/phosphoenolpyruvate mutase family protein [Nitrososphaerota archaeon]|nr:isocitrate lyase/phosphoenolpyruvate mutase family protein [Nitrososphaerota archaeon]MDG6922230.1 isocitrate lyase/phosphoenolpyruvate mutase family protein [Nitrososphaerota archaeon]